MEIVIVRTIQILAQLQEYQLNDHWTIKVTDL